MSLAIAYAMKKKGHKMAHGGAEMCAHGSTDCHMCHGGKMAEGGFAHEEEESGYRKMPKEISYGVHSEKEDGTSVSGAHLREGKMHDAKSMHRGKLDQLRSMKKPELYAEGGMIEEEEESGYEPNPMEHPDHTDPHAVENQDDREDMIGRIMKHRAYHYSKGGRVANDTPIKADFEDNQFDDLVKDDDLEQHDTGANSGDELGDAQEDEDRRDIVSRIMKSRRLKDRMPHPM